MPDRKGPLLPRASASAPARLGREEVAASQRGRLLVGIVDAASEKGFPNVTITDVVANAGVSRKTFYDHFDDKVDCFLAAYDAGVEILLGRVAQAFAAHEPGPEQLRAALVAYLEGLAEDPPFARAFLVEVYAAGDEALRRRVEVLDRFGAAVEAIHRSARDALPGWKEVTPFEYGALVGAMSSLVTTEVAAGRAASLPALEDDLMAYVIACFTAPAS